MEPEAEALMIRVREAMGEAVAACMEAAVSQNANVQAEAWRRVDDLLDARIDARNAGLNFRAIVNEVKQEIVARFVRHGMPHEHATFFVGVPLELMMRELMRAEFGEGKLKEWDDALRTGRALRANPAVGWLLSDDGAATDAA